MNSVNIVLTGMGLYDFEYSTVTIGKNHFFGDFPLKISGTKHIRAK